jgi:microcystin-dependent protein
MSDQYLGEIRAFGFNFAPYDWLQCNGQLLPVSQYAALFSLLGTYYGGNGTTNFGLPNLQGNVPMDWGTSVTGTSYVIGEMGGSPSVTLLANQVSQATTGSTNIPSPSVWLGDAGPGKIYATTGVLNTPLSGNAIGPTGGGQPHENRQPFLTVNFCIATSGAFPPRS